jgi:transposase
MTSSPESQQDYALNHLRTKLYPYLKTQFVPRSKHSAMVIKIYRLRLTREIIAVYPRKTQMHSWQNTELLNVKPGGK